MEIIDAHIHLFTGERAIDLARRAGHENSEGHLRQEYRRLGLSGAVVMGNRSLALEAHVYPGYIRYCVGLDSSTAWKLDLNETYDMVEKHLYRDACVGIKLYPGYNFEYISDKIYIPLYELAERHGKPVAVHTGETSFSGARLKYCHPLVLDEVAASFPGVRFVMCHLGNPWITDAAAVISKNPNVCADLSGLLEGFTDMGEYFLEQEGYLNHIMTWLAYMDAYDRLMFGTDWPLANIQNYVDLVLRLIPEKHREKVFSGNARRIYGLDFTGEITGDT